MGVFLFVYSVVIGTFILFAMLVHSRDSWHHISYSIQICLNILTCATILLESFVKRNEQKKLLLQFNDIDLFLKHQIGIEVDYYAKQHQRYKTHFIQLISLNLSSVAALQIAVFLNTPLTLYEFVLLLFVTICSHVATYIISLRVYQLTIFVDIIGERYGLRAWRDLHR